MIELAGITIHDPDVVFTDLALALVGGWFGWRLWNAKTGMRVRTGAVLMGGLASAAFWGAVFHAFFPANTATLPGFIAWIPVSLSIVVASSAMLELALVTLLPRLSRTIRRAMVVAYALAFAGVVLLVDESFSSIVRFYLPALLLLLLAAGVQAVRGRSRAWALVATGLLLSIAAAWFQQARVAIHPVYFDHNAVYHVVQGAALVFIYLGFRGTTASRANPTSSRA